jgi:hypothetical protein
LIKIKYSFFKNLNSKLFIATGILFCFNFLYVLGAENIIDRIQVSLITFAPVLLALILFSIKKLYNYSLIKLPILLFILTANITTLFLYLMFAFQTNLFTTVEGWMNSIVYLLLLPIYAGIASLVVSATTFLVILIIRIFKRKH